jgi:serine/threonine protein kinase/Leucine-rich repeat (LRR) protein
MMTACPDREQLSGFVLGLLPERAFEDIADHVERCPSCEAAVQTLEGTPDTVVSVLRQPVPADPVLAESGCMRAVEQIQALVHDSVLKAGATSSAVDTPMPRARDKPLDFLAPGGAPDELGRVGPYRILRQLGAGGMGIVFQAEDVQLKRQVALKMLHPDAAAKRGARERFLREARAAAALEHEHIVTIFQVGEERGTPYLAMQLLRGLSLEDRLRRAEGACPPVLLSVPQVLRLGRQIARGLGAAHAQGLIHRDIKPANLWLEPERGGHVKILDFGLARAVGDEAHLTQSGASVGTPAYMAPEQARGEGVDHRCDLFSLGVVLYRMCTGRLPFTGTSTMAVLTSLATDTPRPVRDLNPAVPPELADLVMQLLSKDPAKRPASANDVAERLQALERFLTIPVAPVDEAARFVPPPPTKRAASSTAHRRWLPVMAAALLLALLPLAYFFGGQVIRIATNRGELVIEVDDPRLEVTVKEQGAVIQDRAGQREITLAAGEHEVEVTIKDAAGKTHFFTKKLTLKRGGREVVNVRHELTKAKPPAEKPGGPKAEPRPARGGEKDADRKAAEWVLSIGGMIKIGLDGREKIIAATKDLPVMAFVVVQVTLTNNPKADDVGLVHLKGLTSLTFLELGGTQVSDAGLEQMKGLTKLIWLDLQGAHVTDAGLVHLKGLSSLMGLNLERTQVTDAGLVHLKGLSSLMGLNLERTQVTDAGLAHLKEQTNLTKLGLGGTQVTDAGLAHLKRLTNLFELSLNGTSVTDAGLLRLMRLTKLARLQLSYTQVSDAGLPALARLTSLERVDLLLTHVTTKGLADFRASRPGLQVTGSNVNFVAAEALLQNGGTVHIRLPGEDKDRPIKAAAELPQSAFQLTQARWVPEAHGDGQDVLESLARLTDPTLDRLEVLDFARFRWGVPGFLAKLPHLSDLSLAKSGLSDAALVHLAGLKKLRRLVLDGNPITGHGLDNLKDLATLRELSLNTATLTDLFAEHLAELKQVEKLSLAGSGLSDAGLKHLAGLRNLKALDLTGTKVTAAGVAGLQKALPKCTIAYAESATPAATDPDRRAAEWVLSLGGTIKIRQDGQEHDIQAAKDLPATAFVVVMVGLSHYRADDAGLVHLMGLTNLARLDLRYNPKVSGAGLVHLKGLTNLTELRLTDTPVSDAGLVHLKGLTNLKLLWLVGSPVSDAGLEHLKGLTNLTSLDLSFTRVSDAGLVHVEGLTNLTYLWFHNVTQVTDAGLVHLKGLTKLHELNLTGTRVSDAGIRHLEGLTNLTRLSLAGTRVSDASLPVMAKMSSLGALNLSSTRVTTKGLTKLKAARPGLQVAWSNVNYVAAEIVLKTEGTVHIRLPGEVKDRPIKSAADLPQPDFQLTQARAAKLDQPVLDALARLTDPKLDSLEVLDLADAPVGVPGFLAKLPHLTDLSLAKCGIADTALVHLAGLKKLRRLVLDGNPIAGHGLGSLKDLAALRELSLNTATLTDLFAEHLAELKQLEKLSLAGSDLSDAGLKHLAGMRNLKELDLTGTKVTAPGVAGLQKALPKCKIIRGPAGK